MGISSQHHIYIPPMTVSGVVGRSGTKKSLVRGGYPNLSNIRVEDRGGYENSSGTKGPIRHAIGALPAGSGDMGTWPAARLGTSCCGQARVPVPSRSRMAWRRWAGSPNTKLWLLNPQVWLYSLLNIDQYSICNIVSSKYSICNIVSTK